MQVDNDLKAGSASPADSLIEVLQLAVNVLVTIQVLHSPVAHGDSDVVHASRGNLVEVIGSDEAAPVLRQKRPALVCANSRTERPLINGCITSCIKDRWSDPWLQHKPATKVDTANLVGSVVKVEAPIYQRK